MSEAYFAMALHIHQPIGNFESVLERAYKNCYLPFIELLSEYPDIKLALHISGCLIDYFEARHPRLIAKLIQMSNKGQIEILGGAYYEPILIAIPRRDLLGQIGIMSEYIRSKFGREPKGMWVPERVWAPSLAEPIRTAGIRYCILDDTHILKEGFRKDEMFGFFLTGNKRKKVAIFSSDKKLRYSIPFGKPSDVIRYFDEWAKKKHHPLFVYGDDGEKFGEWPGTHKWVFEQGWLKNFFDELMRNKDWLKLVHFSDYLKSHSPIREVELHEASYDEMMEWSGGSWLNFLSKYPEANQLHKKMLYVSSKVEKIERKHKKNQAKEIEKAKRELYMGQCNCAYWHGVFGGIYLYHLRSAVYNHLIKAEKIIGALQNEDKRKWLELHELDFDMDGRNELVIEDNAFFIYIDPSEGGVIKELDYRPFSFNLVNTISRKKESYHQKILESIQQSGSSKVATIHDGIKIPSPNLKNELSYDKFDRSFLRSYFVKKEIRFEDFINSSYEELGDFSECGYSVERKDNGIILQRESMVSNTKIRLSKELQIKSENEIEIGCSVEKKTSAKLNALLGIEFNVTMPDLDADRYCYYFDGKNQKNSPREHLNTKGCTSPLSFFNISDSLKELGISFNFSKRPLNVWYFPVKTVSQSERAYELNYQCSCIFGLWDLDFNKKSILDFKLNIIMVK